MFRHSNEICFSQEESAHFGLRVLKRFGLEVPKDFGLKKLPSKNQQNSQRSLNYTKSSYIIFLPRFSDKTSWHILFSGYLYQNILIFSILLTRRIDALWSKGIDTSWSGDFETVFHRKLKMKNRQYSQQFLNSTNFSWIIFDSKLS